MSDIHPLFKPVAVLSLVIVAVISTADAGAGNAPKVKRGSLATCEAASSVIGCGGVSTRGSAISFRSAN